VRVSSPGRKLAGLSLERWLFGSKKAPTPRKAKPDASYVDDRLFDPEPGSGALGATEDDFIPLLREQEGGMVKILAHPLDFKLKIDAAEGRERGVPVPGSYRELVGYSPPPVRWQPTGPPLPPMYPGGASDAELSALRHRLMTRVGRGAEAQTESERNDGKDNFRPESFFELCAGLEALDLEGHKKCDEFIAEKNLQVQGGKAMAIPLVKNAEEEKYERRLRQQMGIFKRDNRG